MFDELFYYDMSARGIVEEIIVRGIRLPFIIKTLKNSAYRMVSKNRTSL
ncbi:hypothetical protein MCI89_10620 [Muricomes sp. OA1]|nr:hypothetical protein [Faecalicatena contorta]MCH1972791.1 hypothetical protein [Muricomes sp. OA1]